MKIRNGFVSNSSSQSFCICGTDFEGSADIFNMLRENNEMLFLEFLDHENAGIIRNNGTKEDCLKFTSQFYPECKPTWELDGLIWDLKAFLKSKGFDLDILAGGSGEYAVAGVSYKRLPDDMTGGQFKAEAKKMLSTLFGETEVEYMEDVMYSE